MQACYSFIALALIVLFTSGCEERAPVEENQISATPAAGDTPVDSLPLEGFFNLHWQHTSGKLFIRIRDPEQPFLYVSWLARGLGSNDIGLDRGQMGATRLVRFQRSGPRMLLLQENPRFRAGNTASPEHSAVKESFAVSVLGAFDIVSEDADSVLIDSGDFFLRDAHGVAARLSETGEGDYTTDSALSAIYMPATRNFPDNTEIEAIVTFVGKPTGDQLPEVVPDPGQATVHIHHSFIRLPDEGYTPLPYDPRSGYIEPGSYSHFKDYASAIDQPLAQAYTPRHRLRKKNPEAAVSEAVDPIVYYVDRAVPEPVRSALIEGAGWWNQAFTAAGYRDAFRVELLPEDADPLDVRYNVIQWVHRATRGWSYGYSVVDPRSGEIIKGHVSLGSLRVRQDYLLAEGLLAPYSGDEVSPEMEDFALARLRQLAAHEVGHTLGLEHNFAASADQRSSVMDYPFPLVTLDQAGRPDLGDAYAEGIGVWDKRVINWGYQDIGASGDAEAAREQTLNQTLALGLLFVADSDARGIGTANPRGSLWDNGNNATDELLRLISLRRVVLDNFSERAIRPGRPLASMEEALVPMYLLHRYQLQAAGKFLGGQYFSYALRGDGQIANTPIEPAEQRRALAALLTTLTAEFLALPPSLTSLIPPRPPGSSGGRELFPRHSGQIFDPGAAAGSAAALTLEVLLNPQRAARMNQLQATDSSNPNFAELLAALLAASWQQQQGGKYQQLQRVINNQVLQGLLQLVANPEATMDVRATALDSLLVLDTWLSTQPETDPQWRAHYRFARLLIANVQGAADALPPSTPVAPPPGSPIGN